MLQNILVQRNLTLGGDNKRAHRWAFVKLKQDHLAVVRGNNRSFDYPRCGLIFQVAARMPAVIRPLMTAAIGIASASAAVPAHPIEEKASAKVASRDEVWRRRNWLRRGWARSQIWMAVADVAAIPTPSAVTAACSGEANSSASTSGAKIAPIAISTTSILARVTRDGG